MSDICPEDRMQILVRAMERGERDALERVDELIEEFADDARLHFLRGSLMASDGQLIEAYQSLARSVELEPEFAIARFQLGFFQLTSGEAAAALDTWGRLDGLHDGHYLRHFVDGLRGLIRDDFAGAIEHLEAGIGANSENPPLNRDMQLIIDQCRSLLSPTPEEGATEVSETSILLGRHSGWNLKH